MARQPAARIPSSPAAEEAPSPCRAFQEDTEAAGGSQRPRRHCAVAVAGAAALLVGAAAAGAAVAWRAGPGAVGASVTQLSEACAWIPSDDCTRDDPAACQCRAVWRSGDGDQGYGPCGRLGERDPCLQGGERPASYSPSEAAPVAGHGKAAPVAGHGKAASVRSSFRNGFFVPLASQDVDQVPAVASEDVDQVRSAFQEAVQAEPDDGPEPAAIAAPTAAPTTSPEASGAPAGAARRGSFLVLGDWGWDEGTHGNIGSSNCQRAIATSMLDKMQELGDVKFIINVGDSFYPAGVESRSDPKWDDHWRNRYAPELRSVPWYSTYGNHDYQHDPCACSDRPEDCAQYNNNASDTNWFYFPDFSWYKEHPELGLEVVSLDLNSYCEDDCQYSSCLDTCKANLDKRTGEAIELFKSRSQSSAAKNMLVFSHYPTDYLSEDLMSGLKSSEGANGAPRHIEYFGGHRHNVDQESCASIAPNNHWLVGGGGGWGIDGDQQGFVVGEISGDFTITSYSVLVDMPCGEGNIQFK